jgi:hypothetical protein
LPASTWPAYGLRVTEPRPHSISWKIVLIHALLPLAVIIVIGGVAVASGRVIVPFRFGEGLGRYALFPMLLAGGASYMLQSGRRRLGRALVIAVGVMLAALFALVVRLMLG